MLDSSYIHSPPLPPTHIRLEIYLTIKRDGKQHDDVSVADFNLIVWENTSKFGSKCDIYIYIKTTDCGEPKYIFLHEYKMKWGRQPQIGLKSSYTSPLPYQRRYKKFSSKSRPTHRGRKKNKFMGEALFKQNGSEYYWIPFAKELVKATWRNVFTKFEERLYTIITPNLNTWKRVLWIRIGAYFMRSGLDITMSSAE